MTTKNATIKDVAREAKVSVASVSRALNGTGGVTPQTRSIVREVADRLHYVPDSAARSLITRRTHTIGVVLPDLHGEFFSELIRGIELATRTRGLHLLVSRSHDDLEDAAATVRAMRRRVDGMLIFSEYADAAFLDANLPSGLPAVLLNGAEMTTRYPVLTVDHRGGAGAMVQHLVRTGRKRIAFIAGPQNRFDAREREQGYRAAMAEFAPDVMPMVITGDFSEASGYRAGGAWLTQQTYPDAVFAANDLMAIGCLAAFKEAGIRVPQDIALAGFDDIPTARHVTPALSTVQVRMADLGRVALECLAVLLDADAEAPALAQTLGCEVIVRETCGGKAPGPAQAGA